MPIKFEKTPYLEVVKKNANLNDDIKIFNYAKKGLNFRYADVSRQEFNQKYSAKGWFGRKITALPTAVWSGIVKTIYHLAQAIIIGFLKALSDDGDYFKSMCFYVGRDFQESFGWLASLFNDRYGQYHIQESGFHKSCYDCFFTDRIHSNTPNNIYDPRPKQGTLQPENLPRNSDADRSSHEQNKSFNFSAQVKEPNVFNNIPLVPPPKQEASYSPNTDLDKEYNEIRNLRNTTEKEKRFARLAETYLDRGDLDQANKTIQEVYRDAQTKKSFLVKLANAFLKKGDQDKALTTINEIQDTKIKEAFIEKIAVSYYEKDNLDMALKTIEEIYSDTRIKEDFIAKIANAFLNKGDQDRALKTINKIYRDTKTKKAFIELSAQLPHVPPAKQKASYSSNTDLDKEFKEIRNSWDTTEKEKRFSALAEAYLNRGDLDQALKTIKEVFSNAQTKESFLVKLANAFLKKGDQDKALKTIDEIWDIKIKEAFIEKIALYYYEKDNLDMALKTINEVYSNTTTKEDLIAKIANAFLNKGDLEKAVKSIGNIYSDTKIKEAFIEKIALYYYEKDNLDMALKTINEVYSNTKTKEDFIAKIATAFLNKGDLDKAVKSIGYIYSDAKIGEAFREKIALYYYEKDNLDMALKTINDVYSDTKTKEDFIAKIANAFLNKGDLDKAIKTIRNIFSDTKIKEAFIEKIATFYYEKNNLDMALKTIEELYSNTKTKESFMIKIANAYLRNGDREKALKTFSGHYNNSDETRLFIVQLALSYFSTNEVNQVLKTIEILVEGLLRNKILENGYHEFYLKIMFGNTAKVFYADMARVCYEQTKVYFSSHNAQAILQEIIRRSTDPSTLQAYLNLKAGQPHHPFESSRNNASSNSNKNNSRTRADPSPFMQSPRNFGYYKVLGLQPGASVQDVKKAYRSLVLKNHPDKIHKDENEDQSAYERRRKLGEEKFKMVSEAYKKLTGE